jgi:carbon monoxide dehydrogenase subunit G
VKISGAYPIEAPPERAYQLLQDPGVLGRCMPGCEGLVRITDDEYSMRMKMALASVSGSFEGKVRIADRNPPTGYRLIVEGAGRIGFLKGDGQLTFSPQSAGTNVSYDGDVQMGGTIAAVGQRLLDMTARMLIKRFFDRVSEEARQT